MKATKHAKTGINIMNPEQYKIILERLLSKHFGISLLDTPYGDRGAVEQLIQEEIQPWEAAAYWAEKVDLERLDVAAFSCDTRKPLTFADQARASE